MKKEPKLVKPPLTYKPKMLELSDRRTGKRWRRMEEEAKRHTLKREKIQHQIRGASMLWKTCEEANQTKARIGDQPKKSPQQRSSHF